jgi:hypothetical protein
MKKAYVLKHKSMQREATNAIIKFLLDCNPDLTQTELLDIIRRRTIRTVNNFVRKYKHEKFTVEYVYDTETKQFEVNCVNLIKFYN